MAGRPIGIAAPELLSRALRYLTLFACCTAFPVLAQVEIPPGATTGGAQPGGLRPLSSLLDESDIPPFSIPPVYERPLGEDEGERVFVRGFVLRGVQDDLDADISNKALQARVEARFAELQSLLESLRVERQGQVEVDVDGFTPEERQRILQFIRESMAQDDPELQALAYEDFVNQLKLQRLERDAGLTIGQLQTIANSVTEYYRERGYFLARAIVPAQEVVDGIVTIQVLEGRLGAVTTQGNQRFDSEALQAPFADLEGRMVTQERMEDALLTLQNFPGLTLSGVFRPGAVVGTADMVLNVLVEDPFAWSVRADNHGSRFTGSRRALFDFNWNQPRGEGDLLNMQLLGSFSPQGSAYGSVRYEHPFSDPSTRWGVELSRNSFDAFDPTTGTSLNVGGESVTFRAFVDHYFIRGRTESRYGRFELSRKRADTVSNGVTSNRDDLLVISAELGKERIDGRSNTITSRVWRIDQGFDGVLGVPKEEEANDPSFPLPYSRLTPSIKFTKLTWNYSWLKALSSTASFLARGSFQYTRDYLVSVEQFNMGGPNNVRAAPISAALRDKGFFGSAELSLRAPGFADKPAWGGQTWGAVFGVTFFHDFALGILNRTPGERLTQANQRLSLGGRGMGIDVALPGKVNMKVMGARLNGGSKFVNNPAGFDESSQLWVEFSRAF